MKYSAATEKESLCRLFFWFSYNGVLLLHAGGADITDQHLRKALEPLIQAEGFQCVDVQLQRTRRARRLRVIVYRESGMDTYSLERLTRGIQFNLPLIVDPGGADLSDLSLEVSSPGSSAL